MNKKSGLLGLSDRVRAAGRGRDTVLAHITPEEAALLKARGGRGSINPATGLPEFEDDSGGSSVSMDSGPSYDYSTPSYDYGYSFPSYDYSFSTPSYDYGYSTPSYDYSTPSYDYSTPSHDYDYNYGYSTPSYDYSPYVPPSYSWDTLAPIDYSYLNPVVPSMPDYGVPDYGVPDYGVPDYGVPDYGYDYAPPVEAYTPPVEPYVPPVEAYTPPVEPYVPPVETYVPPVEAYTPPVETYTPPAPEPDVTSVLEPYVPEPYVPEPYVPPAPEPEVVPTPEPYVPPAAETPVAPTPEPDYAPTYPIYGPGVLPDGTRRGEPGYNEKLQALIDAGGGTTQTTANSTLNPDLYPTEPSVGETITAPTEVPVTTADVTGQETIPETVPTTPDVLTPPPTVDYGFPTFAYLDPTAALRQQILGDVLSTSYGNATPEALARAGFGPGDINEIYSEINPNFSIDVSQPGDALGPTSVNAEGQQVDANGNVVDTGVAPQITPTSVEEYNPGDYPAEGATETMGLYSGAYPGAAPERNYSENVLRAAPAVIGVESSNNPNAKNPLSSATGLGQFVSGTWLEQVAKYYPNLGSMKDGKFTPTEGYTTKEILDMRKDPGMSRDLTAGYLSTIEQNFASKGLPTDPGSLYLGYFLGEKGAQKVLTADPNTPVSSLLSQDAIDSNSRLLAGKTAGEVINATTNRLESRLSAVEAAGQAPAATPSLTDRIISAAPGAAVDLGIGALGLPFYGPVALGMKLAGAESPGSMIASNLMGGVGSFANAPASVAAKGYTPAAETPAQIGKLPVDASGTPIVGYAAQEPIQIPGPFPGEKVATGSTTPSNVPYAAPFGSGAYALPGTTGSMAYVSPGSPGAGVVSALAEPSDGAAVPQEYQIPFTAPAQAYTLPEEAAFAGKPGETSPLDYTAPENQYALPSYLETLGQPAPYSPPYEPINKQYALPEEVAALGKPATASPLNYANPSSPYTLPASAGGVAPRGLTVSPDVATARTFISSTGSGFTGSSVDTTLARSGGTGGISSLGGGGGGGGGMNISVGGGGGGSAPKAEAPRTIGSVAARNLEFQGIAGSNRQFGSPVVQSGRTVDFGQPSRQLAYELNLPAIQQAAVSPNSYRNYLSQYRQLFS